MKNLTPPPAATAEMLAANFHVTELEPRMENAWSGGADGTDVEHGVPACKTAGTC